MTKVAELTVPIEPGGNDSVVIKLVFGQQELTMSAVGQRTGKRMTVKCAFVQNSFA